MIRQVLGTVAAAVVGAALLCGGGKDAAADPIVIKVTRTLDLQGALNATQTLSIPAFTGPGTLTSVQVVFALDEVGQDIFVNGQPSGEVEFSASATFSFSVPSPFPIVVPPVDIVIPETKMPVFGGNYFLAGASGANQMPIAATVTTDLAAFANGPFAFVATMVGTLDAQTPDGITLVSALSASGTLVVTYTSDFDRGTAIPEPSGLAVAGLGLTALAFLRRRRMAPRTPPQR